MLTDAASARMARSTRSSAGPSIPSAAKIKRRRKFPHDGDEFTRLIPEKSVCVALLALATLAATTLAAALGALVHLLKLLFLLIGQQRGDLVASRLHRLPHLIGGRLPVTTL